MRWFCYHGFCSGFAMNSLSKLMGEGRKVHYIIGTVTLKWLVHSASLIWSTEKKSFCWFWVLVWSAQYSRAFCRLTLSTLLELPQTRATSQISQTLTNTWLLPYVSRIHFKRFSRSLWATFQLISTFRDYWPRFFYFWHLHVHLDVQPAPPLCSKTRNHRR